VALLDSLAAVADKDAPTDLSALALNCLQPPTGPPPSFPMWHVVEKASFTAVAKADPIAQAVDSLWCSKDDLVKSEDFLMAEVFLGGGSSERKAKKKKLKKGSKDGKRFKKSSARLDTGDRSSFKATLNGGKVKGHSVRPNKTRAASGGGVKPKPKSYSEKRESTADTKEEEELGPDLDLADDDESGPVEKKKRPARKEAAKRVKKYKEDKEDEEREIPVIPDPNCANPEAMVSNVSWVPVPVLTRVGGK
jgi:hypothetical protein